MKIGTTAVMGTTQSARPAATDSSVAWRSVALPSEHGGWSLTAEPAILGLVVAWSTSGLSLGVAAMLAFLARTPLKLVLVDRFRDRWLARTKLAALVAAVELTLLTLLAAYSLSKGQPFWPPLAVAAPVLGVELWYGMRSRSRRLLPELAGSIGIGSIATAIALAGGASSAVAWGLWVVVAARSVAAIPYVRTQILRSKSKPWTNRQSDAAQLAALAFVAIGRAFDLIPSASVVVIAAVVTINLFALRLTPKPATVIGIQQMFVGLAVVLTTALALR